MDHSGDHSRRSAPPNQPRLPQPLQTLRYAYSERSCQHTPSPHRHIGASRAPPERAGRGAVEKADHRNSWVLRVSRERPRRRRAAEQRDEVAPPHSITSSARKRIEVRTATPMVFVLERASSSCRQAAALFLIAPMIAVSMAPPAPPAIA